VDTRIESGHDDLGLEREMKRSAAAVVAAIAPLAAALALPAQAETRPHVVELFTSQACSSCPPADALLAELARRPDVIALGLHITYWNGTGWTDKLSLPAATARQQDYGNRFNGGQVYTPEIVVDGAHDMVGSDRAAVLAALAAPPPPTVAPISFAADERSVTIGAGGGSGEVLLARFVHHETTKIAGGENAGRTLDDANGVLILKTLGQWTGAPARFAIDAPCAGEGVAILVQPPGGGPIIAAAAITAASGS
jgi:hypothetical protein